MAGEIGLESDQQVDMRLNSGPPVVPYAPGVTPPTAGPYVPGVSAPKYGPFVPGSPGGSANFASTPTEKKAVAGTIENELEPATKSAAEHADDATNAAHKGFDGWETAAGLKKVADTWDQQVKTLMGRLSSEKVALRGAEGLFARNDTGVGSQFVKSALNGV